MTAPASCPSCGTQIPEGVTRCPGCKRVFGEQNRCPSCHAIAPAMERKGKLICAACGAPRSAEPGVEVLAGGSGKGSAIALRVLGYSLFAAAFVVAGVSALFDQNVLALILGTGMALPGWLTLRRASRAAKEADANTARRQLQKVRALMADHGGRVTAPMVASQLGVAVEAADALLTQAGKDGLFEVDFDESGTVFYIDPAFAARGARVRIEAGAPDEIELERARSRDAKQRG